MRIPVVVLAFLTSLILAVALFYFVVEEAPGKAIGDGSLITRESLFFPRTNASLGVPVMRSSSHGIECYMLLGTYDRVGFNSEVTVLNASYQWSVHIDIEDLVFGERFNYSDVYYVPRPVTPEFYAPRPSLYRVRYMVVINVTKPYGELVPYTIWSTMVGEQYKRLDFYNTAPPVLVALVVLEALVIGVSSRVKAFDKYSFSGLTGLVRWELRSLWLFLLFPVIALLHAFLVLRFDSGVGGLTVALGPVTIRRTPDFLLLYLIIAEIATVMLFVYKWEGKHERTSDLLAQPRIKRYLAKLLAVLTITFLPVALTSLLLYITWQHALVFNRPDIFLPVFASHLLYYLLVTLFAFSVASTISMLLPYTSVSLFTTVVLTVLLYIQSPLGGVLGLNLSSDLLLLYPTTRCTSLTYFFDHARPFPFMKYDVARMYLIPSLVLLSISMLMYCMRENP